MICRLRLRPILLIWLMTSCGVNGDPIQPTPTALRVESQGYSEIAQADVFQCGVVDAAAATAHTIAATIDYPDKVVTSVQTTVYVNRTGHSLDEILFSIEANSQPQVFELDGVMIADDIPAAFELAANRLIVELPTSLDPGCAVSITLAFDIHVPPVRSGRRAFRGYLGYTERQLNLANWLPTVAARVDGEWLVPAVTSIGEQQIADMADWSLELTVVDGPEGLQIAAPGTVQTLDDGRLSIRQGQARDLALSLSDRFVLHTRSSAGIAVELYAFADTLVQTEAGVVDGAQAALTAAVDAVSMYADLFGPAVADRLVIVEGDFPDGMEFSGLVFVSRDWFQTYNGTPQSYLIIITVHEIAHQWWYASVGSDPANSPWLDEALATYSEYIYYEEYHPDLRDWWWRFRVERFVPQDYVPAGQVDSSVYRFGSIREYINAVYLRGARMLHALRAELGTDAFFELLRRYADAGRGRIMNGELFWSLLTPEQIEQVNPLRALYFSG